MILYFTTKKFVVFWSHKSESLHFSGFFVLLFACNRTKEDTRILFVFVVLFLFMWLHQTLYFWLFLIFGCEKNFIFWGLLQINEILTVQNVAFMSSDLLTSFYFCVTIKICFLLWLKIVWFLRNSWMGRIARWLIKPFCAPTIFIGYFRLLRELENVRT